MLQTVKNMHKEILLERVPECCFLAEGVNASEVPWLTHGLHIACGVISKVSPASVTRLPGAARRRSTCCIENWARTEKNAAFCSGDTHIIAEVEDSFLCQISPSGMLRKYLLCTRGTMGRFSGPGFRAKQKANPGWPADPLWSAAACVPRLTGAREKKPPPARRDEAAFDLWHEAAFYLMHQEPEWCRRSGLAGCCRKYLLCTRETMGRFSGPVFRAKKKGRTRSDLVPTTTSKVKGSSSRV